MAAIQQAAIQKTVQESSRVRFLNVPSDQQAARPPSTDHHHYLSYIGRHSRLRGRLSHARISTSVKAEIDIPTRHELFLLGDGERKVEMETVTQVANAALFTFNKEDHTLANMLRDKLFRLEHVTFSAYKVPHPLFATFQLRVHTDGEITPKAALIKACGELITELQELDQEFTKEFELKKMAANVPNGGLDI